MDLSKQFGIGNVRIDKDGLRLAASARGCVNADEFSGFQAGCLRFDKFVGRYSQSDVAFLGSYCFTIVNPSSEDPRFVFSTLHGIEDLEQSAQDATHEPIEEMNHGDTECGA